MVEVLGVRQGLLRQRLERALHGVERIALAGEDGEL
jgi:hypothetical protein